MKRTRNSRNGELCEAAMRKNPIATLSDDDAKTLFASLETHFGTEWLKMSGNHPLRVLWRRDDAISSMELLTLAQSIRTMSTIAQRWTKRQIQLSKGSNSNQQKGALFEIIGLGAFASAGHKVTPAPDSNPGYDGLVQAEKSGLIYRVSLKHHGLSSHETAFYEVCRSIEADLAARARAANLTAFLASITSTVPWSVCKELVDFFRSNELVRILSAMTGKEPWAPPSPLVFPNNWSVKLSHLPVVGLAIDHTSYLIQVITPHHRNEYQNLEEKLNNACANFNRYSMQDRLPGLIVLHLPPTAHVASLAAWVRRYLEEEKAASIDAVFLYQPDVVRNSTFSKVRLAIHLQELENPKCRITGDDRRTLFFLGTLFPEPFRTSHGPVNIEDSYSYQSGNFFVDASRRNECLLTFTNAAGLTASAPFGVSTPGAGLHFHEVSKDANGNEVIASPRVSFDDRLLIL